MMTEKPTLHHLNNSQSQRILWLLEELHIDYDLKLYTRYESGPKKSRAPEELKYIHPLGKSPILVTCSGQTITESSSIASYLISTYDKGKFHGNDALRDDTLTSFANASLAPVITTALLTELLVSQSPFFLRFLFVGVRNAVKKTYVTGEFESMLAWLDMELGDMPYFMGENPGRADFMLSWPLDMISQWGFADLSKYKRLNGWYMRCHARDAWKRSLERGNGYKLKIS